MLTKNDLQQIQKVVDTSLEQKLDPVKTDLKYLRKKVNRINKTVGIIVKNYDEGDVKLAKRIKKIEQHLALSEQN